MSKPGQQPAGSDARGAADRLSDRHWLWVPVVFLVGLVMPMLFATWTSLQLQDRTIDQAFVFEMESRADVLANGLIDPVRNLKPDSGQALVETLMRDPRVLAVEVASRAQGNFLKAGRPYGDDAAPLHLSRELKFENEAIGTLSLVVDRSALTGAFTENNWLLFAVGTVQVLFSFAIILFVARFVRRGAQVTALRESEQRFRTIANSTPTITVISRWSDGTILYVNDEMRRRVEDKYAVKLVGRRISEFYDDGMERKELLRKLEREGQIQNHEIKVFNPQGKDRWLLTSSVRITFEGEPAIYSSYLDITQRKVDEQRLQDSEERYVLAVQGTKEGLWDWNIRTGDDYFSPRWREILGYEQGELAPKVDTFLELIHPGDREQVGTAIEAHLQQRQPYDLEFRLRHKDGAYVWVAATGQAVWDEKGEAVRMAGSIRDITRQREIEEQLRQAQKMEAVGHLTGGIAHDFNNLLTVIIGNLELTRERPDAADAGDLIDGAIVASRRGAELTHQLLAFSRQQVLAPRRIDIGQLLAQFRRMAARILGENIEVRSVVEPDLAEAMVDPGQLENALLNLSINARDAMPEGGRIDIRARSVAWADLSGKLGNELAPGNYIEIALRDNGGGIPPDIRDKVFEPFFTTKQVGQGTGLGLSSVFGFVKQSSGHVEIDSDVGKGTTVRLYLPCAAAPEADAETAETERQPAMSDGETILIVEDDAGVRRFAQSALKRLGYRVIEAEDGASAARWIDGDETIDLLLTDVILPGDLSGPDIAAAFNANHRDGHVLFMSGYPKDHLGTKGRLADDIDLLAKPFSPKTLQARVRAILEAE